LSSTGTYDLKFTIASRTILSKRLNVVHWPAFGRANWDNFIDRLPAPAQGDIDGYVVHSLETDKTLPSTSTRDGKILYVAETYPRYLTRLEGSFEDFLAGMSGKSRSTLRRKARKFAKADGGADIDDIDWRQYDTPAGISDFLDLAAPLAKRTYQARLFDGALPDDGAFRQDALKLAQEGRVRAYLLFLEGEAVAYLYTPLEDRAFIYAYLGFDEAHAALSPGTVLQFLVHEKLFEEKPADWFDFTEGEGAHKSQFANRRYDCATIICLDNSLRNRLLVVLHRLWNGAIEGLKKLAEKLNLTARIRKAFR
jgi:CelD/BcsL family acetyltransferase involved in cellulose biosynthesis